MTSTSGSSAPTLSEQHAKIRQELRFYFWTGIILYVTNNVLYLIDYLQRGRQDPVAYLGLFCSLALELFIIARVKRMKNWARNLFIVKFVLFSFFFYPQAVILRMGSWMYSAHFPHGVFQKISNLGNLAYEIFFDFHHEAQ